MSLISEETNTGAAGALISSCGTYRYELWRVWNKALPEVVFIMLNPSTADAESDDPTVRRCRGFAKAWGYGSIRIVNLFALRSPNPMALLQHRDPVGPENNDHIARVCRAAGVSLIVAAWGAHGPPKIPPLIRDLAGKHAISCLGVNKGGSPKHPLYCRSDLRPVPYLEANL